MSPKTEKRLEVMFEFLVFGIVIGVIEDVIAVKVVSGEAITWTVVGIIVLIAVPFALLGEVVADNVDFIKLFKKLVAVFKTAPPVPTDKSRS